MPEFVGHQMCPGCGHHTSGAIAGRCTSFVVSNDAEIAAGAPMARYCDHDCHREIAGESLRERVMKSLRGLPVPAEGGD